MDPIERLNLYMTMWEQWVRRYESYKYHGQRLICQKGIYLIPVFVGKIVSPTPPIYYKYKYTGDEEFGFVKFFFRRQLHDLLSLRGNYFSFNLWGDLLPWDALNLVISNPKCDGSFHVDMQFEDISCGIYKADCCTGGSGCCTLSFQNPFGTLIDWYKKITCCVPPLYVEFWRWSKLPSSWSYSYTFNWRYLPLTKKYDYWDSFGRVAYKKSVSSFLFVMHVNAAPAFPSYPGSCYRSLGVDFSNIAVFSDVFFPPP